MQRLRGPIRRYDDPLAGLTRAGAGLLLALVAIAMTACYPSNVIEEQSRHVVVELPSVEWNQAPATFPAGLYHSEEITGEAAGALVQLYYYFGASGESRNTGSYSGAALVLGTTGPAFQVLSGEWVYVNGELDLGDGSGPLVVQVAENRLRLASETGTVVFVGQELR